MNGYGEQPYGPSQAWPYGPGRPGSATAAAVLGFVTGGLTIAFLLVMLVAVLAGQEDVATWLLLLLGVPCAVGLLTGAAELMRRRSTSVLFGSAVSAVAVLLVALVAGLAELAADDVVGLVIFVVIALPLPVLTAVFAKVGTVTGWVADDRR